MRPSPLAVPAPPPLDVDGALRDRIAALYLRDYRGVNRLDPERVVDDFLSPVRFQEQRGSMESMVGPLAGRSLLEVGSGVGAFVAYLRRAGERAFGVEIDPGAVRVARELAARNGIGDGAYVVGTGEALPFADGAFDLVFSNSVLEHVADPDRVLGEAMRVLRGGGRLHFIIPSYASFYEGHYGIFWLPHLPKGLARAYVRLWGRPADLIDTLAFVTPGRLRRALRGMRGVRVIGWGTEVFLRRMATLEFSEWGDLGRVKRWLRLLERLGANRLAARLCVAFGWYNPIILTLEKTGPAGAVGSAQAAGEQGSRGAEGQGGRGQGAGGRGQGAGGRGQGNEGGRCAGAVARADRRHPRL